MSLAIFWHCYIFPLARGLEEEKEEQGWSKSRQGEAAKIVATFGQILL